jgi:7-keto-8-aminopelargonate synthetase-like enzyme
MSDWLKGLAAPELHAVATDFVAVDGADLLGRWEAHQAFWEARLRAGLDPYGRTLAARVGTETAILDASRTPRSGVNFASDDALGLATHPAVQAAAAEAIACWGVHAAGTLAGQGASPPLRMLEEKLADMLCYRDAMVLPSGHAAGKGVIRTLVRSTDHVVIDALADPGMRQAAGMATRQVHPVPHAAQEAVARRLARIREEDPRAGILVVTESLFAADSSVPDLTALQATCRTHGATLLVAMTRDLGAIGDAGLGFLGDQGLLGEVDIVVGSLAHSLAANGGFVASSAPALRRALGVFAEKMGESAALSPAQAAAAAAALDIVRSPEGARRRRSLRTNVRQLREGLAARGFQLLGQPGPVIPVLLGEVGPARLMTRAAFAAGALVNLMEPPEVPHDACRWQLHAMADHTPEQIRRMIALAVAAREAVETTCATARP